MKYYGNITNDRDLVDKYYVDNNSGGGSSDYKIVERTNNISPLKEGLLAYQTTDDRIYKYDGSDWILIENSFKTYPNNPAGICSLDVRYKNHMVVLDQTASNSGTISTPGGGIKSYVLGFNSTIIYPGSEYYVYARANEDLCQIAIPISITVGSASKPVIINGYYSGVTGNEHIINLRYVTHQEEKDQEIITVFDYLTSATIHIFYDGYYFYFDRFTVYNPPVENNTNDS